MPQYFEPAPEAANRPRQVELALRDLGRAVALATDGGVFSGDRIDPGTRVLVDHGPPVPAAGDLLDLGCGYGPLAVATVLLTWAWYVGMIVLFGASLASHAKVMRLEGQSLSLIHISEPTRPY